MVTYKETVFRFEQKGLQTIIGLMNRLQTEGVKVSRELQETFNEGLDTVKYQQSMNGMKEQYTQLQKDLKPIGEEIRKSFRENIVEPMQKPEQLVQGIMDKQREMAQFSEQMGLRFKKVELARSKAIDSLREQMSSLVGMKGPIQSVFNDLSKKFGTMSTDIGKIKKDFEGQFVDKLVKKFTGFGGAMAMPLEGMQLMHKHGQKMNTSMGRLGMSLRLATHGLRGFRMEMLGVMFFGMMMQKMLFGLLRPAAEVLGIFEIWRIMLQVLFLPLMIKLLPKFLELVDYILNLDPAIQEAIGWGVLFAAVLATIIMFVGQLALGVGSLILALGPLGLGLIEAGGAGALLTSIAEGIGISLTALAAIVAIVAAVFVGMFIAWKEDFLGFKGFFKKWRDSIKQIFSGLIDIITGIFTADFEKAFGGLMDIIEGFGEFTLNSIAMVGIGIIRLLKIPLDFMKDMWKRAFVSMFEASGKFTIKFKDQIDFVLMLTEKFVNAMAKIPIVGDKFQGLSIAIKKTRDELKDFNTRDLNKMISAFEIELGLKDMPVTFKSVSSNQDFFSGGLPQSFLTDSTAKSEQQINQPINIEIVNHNTFTGITNVDEVMGKIKDIQTELVDELKREVRIPS